MIAKLFLFLIFSLIPIQINLSQETKIILSTNSSYPDWSPDEMKIVFHSDRLDNNYEIYSIDRNGGNLTRLTDNMSNDLTPVWSSDGSKIAFQSDRDGNSEIYIMNSDGSSQINITQFAGEDMHPKWSADNKKIIFSSIRGYWNLVDIYEINIDGSGLKRLTVNVEIDTYADWSPDGNKIITRRIIAGNPNSEIFLLDSGGGNPVNLTNDPAFDGWPSWHPDGQSIFYASENEKGIANIFRMKINGDDNNSLMNVPGSWATPRVSSSGKSLVMNRSLNENTDIYTLDISHESKFPKPIKITDVQDKYPGLSPDGTKILFQSNRSQNWQLFVINYDGSGLKRITDNSSNDIHACWSPDGNEIAFVSDRDGNREIYLMNADGSNQRNVSHNQSEDSHPNWSPGGDKIIFNSSRNIEKELSIYLMNSDGTNIKALSDNNVSENESYASFLPDGSKIVFVRWLEENNGEIFIMNSDGSSVRNITNNKAFDGYPCWTNNGKSVLFSSNRTGQFQLYRIDTDGSGLTQLLKPTLNEHQIRANSSVSGETVVYNSVSNSNTNIKYFRKSSINREKK